MLKSKLAKPALSLTVLFATSLLATSAALADGNGCNGGPNESSYCTQNFPGNSLPQYPNDIPHHDTSYPGMTEAAPTNTESTSAADRLKAELAEVGVVRFTSSDYKPGTVRHIVLFRYASNVTDAQKAEVIQRFLALQQLAKRNGKKYIVSIETGGDISGEGADQGLEQGFIVTFKSQGDRNYYVGQPVVTDPNFYDPAHQAFKDFVGPLLDQNGALVFDFSLN